MVDIRITDEWDAERDGRHWGAKRGYPHSSPVLHLFLR
jgi:hypothetical protein